MIISQGKGWHIKATLRENHAVVMEMAWHMPKMPHSVAVDIWYSPNNQATEEFLANFSGLALALKDHLTFHPHHYVLDGRHIQCDGRADDPNAPCYNMCTNNGRYCFVSHGYNQHGVTGKDVVTESLRRMCLLKHHSNEGFWAYINHFQTFCGTADYFANKDCVKDALKHSNIKEQDIEDCMKDSGDITKDETNQILEEAILESARFVEVPAVFINGLPHKWPLSARSVFESFCMGFQTEGVPHVCSMCAFCGDPVACASRTPMHCNANDGDLPDSEKRTTTDKKKGRGFAHFVLVTFILTAAGGFIYYKKYMDDGNRASYREYSLAQAFLSDTD
jgi:hypothetical protein